MKPKKISAPLGAGLVILSSFFYASYGIWTKLMGDFFDGYTASALRSILLVRGVKLIDAGIAGVLGLLEIVFGVVFGVVFFLERPDLVVLLGMAIIIVASAIPYFKDFKLSKKF